MKMKSKYGNLSTEVFTEREKNRLIELGWHEVVPKKEKATTPKVTKTTTKKTTKGVKNGKEN